MKRKPFRIIDARFADNITCIYSKPRQLVNAFTKLSEDYETNF